MKAWRVWGVVVAAAVLLNVVGVGAGASGEDPEGYCAADGTPVVAYWPPGWEGNYDVMCYQGRISFANRIPVSIGENPIVLTNPELPDDFGRWVNLALNRAGLRNPYHDVYPYVVKSTGRTLIPLRYVSEAFGAGVAWNGDTRTATITWRGEQVVVTIGSAMAYVNGKGMDLDQPPLIWKDRTMVPLRFIAEAFGAQVEWDESSSSVGITLPGIECPPEYCVR